MRLRQSLFFTLTILLTSFANAGAWGVGPFENDDALDWVYELEESAGFAAIETAIQTVASTSGYLEAPLGSRAIAAAETLAALNGKAPAELPEEVSAWVSAQNQEPNKKLLADARKVLRAVLDEDRSEIAQLWSDNSRLYDDWRAHLQSLTERLK